MRRAKLTPFFPPEVKPVHVGLYHATLFPKSHTGDSTYPRFLWNGTQWWNHHVNLPVQNKNRYWRGLARKPR